MTRAGVSLAIVCVLFASSEASGAEKKRAKKVDNVALARLLLVDGHAKRALAALGEVDLEKDEVDLAEFYRLRGLAQHDLQRYPEAVADLKKAIENGEKTPPTWYALANAQLAAEDPKGTIATLEKAPPEIWTIWGSHKVKALAYDKMNDKYSAFDAVDVGFSLFPKQIELERMRVLIFLQLGLSQAGLEAAQKLFQRAEVTQKDYVALSEALGAARDLKGAIQLLEGAVLRYPEDTELRKQLARRYFESKHPLSAAQVLHPLALMDPDAALLTAELYRKAGKLQEAIRVNGLVTNQKDKVRQRLNLLIESERFRQAAALDERLSRLGLLKEERLLYALAYAHFVSGNTARVEKLLGRVSEPELYAKSTAIRRALEVCRENVWECD